MNETNKPGGQSVRVPGQLQLQLPNPRTPHAITTRPILPHGWHDQEQCDGYGAADDPC